MKFFISSLYMLQTSGVFAAPILNSTALHVGIAPGWVSGPKTRGTWQILYSCLFTLVLCVYTAIHLNVPAKSDSKVRFWLRKLKWVVVAILAPEIVVYTAFEQWYLARELLKELMKIASDSEDEDFKKWYHRDAKHPPFNMAYAHYALMGGFAADVEDIHNVLERVTLNSNGILFLAKNGHFCRLNPGDIEDKSKADYLAKGLVCVQVVWIVGQAIERKIANLPITLLEAHTIVHVICALVMYALWYEKPLSVVCPTIVEFGENRDLLAFLLETCAPRNEATSKIISPPNRLYKYSSGFCGEVLPYNLGFETKSPAHLQPFEPDIYFCKPECVISGTAVSTSVAGSIYQHSIGDHDNLKINIPDHRPFEPLNGEICCTMVSGQCLESKIGFFWDMGPGRSQSQRRMHLCKVSLTTKDVHRLQLVGRAWERIYPSVVSTATLPHDSNQHLVPLTEQIVRFLGISFPLAPRCPNVKFNVLHNNDFGTMNMLLWVALAIIPAAYGGVHLTALSLLFPTTMERVLWKLSCYFLVGYAGMICLVMVYREIYFTSYSKDTGRRFRRSALYKWWHSTDRLIESVVLTAISCIFGLVCLLTLIYIAARLFVVVESFISLRHVPLGVYQKPDLDIMGNIPHL